VKLTDLNPKFFTLGHWASPHIFAIGLTFDCPCCRDRRLAVFFDTPIDPDNVAKTFMEPWTPTLLNHNLWKRSGDTFDTLTLTPSIDASAHGHWHGFIQNGEIR
jgi:hypothetical protein